MQILAVELVVRNVMREYSSILINARSSRNDFYIVWAPNSDLSAPRQTSLDLPRPTVLHP